MNLDSLSHEELVGILQKTLKYLGPKELEEITTIKTERVVVDHTKRKLMDALSLSDKTCNEISSKIREFLEVVLVAPVGSPRSFYVEKLYSIWKKFNSVEKALFTVLIIEYLTTILIHYKLKRRDEDDEFWQFKS